MRLTVALVAAVLSSAFNALAHADSVKFIAYTGTVLASGSVVTGSYYGTPTIYNDVPVAATVILKEFDGMYGVSFWGQEVGVNLPDGFLSSGDFFGLYLDYHNCAYDQSGCYENIEFGFDENEYFDQGLSLPTPDLYISGGRNSTINSDTGAFFSDDIGFSGELQLVTTPEPSSVALLGTGLLGFAGVIRKRFEN